MKWQKFNSWFLEYHPHFHAKNVIDCKAGWKAALCQVLFNKGNPDIWKMIKSELIEFPFVYPELENPNHPLNESGEDHEDHTCNQRAKNT
jgi:hypothetical protein